MNVLTRGMRNAFRNATRTLSIVTILGLSIGLSMVMLIAHQAVQDKIKTTLSSIGNTVSIQPAGFTTGSGVNNALTTSELKKVQELPHVTNVLETVTDLLQTIGTSDQPTAPGGGLGGSSGSGGGDDSNAQTSLTSPDKLNCSGDRCSGGGTTITNLGGRGGVTLPSNFSLPLTIVGTNYPTDAASLGADTLKITSGGAINGSKDNDEAMVSTTIASKNDLKVGSTFTAYGKTLTVAAIFNSDSTNGNNTVIVSLPTEQSLSNQTGDVTSATATVDSLTNLNSTTSAIEKKLGSAADVTSDIAQANDALESLSTVKNISLYSLIGAVAAGAIIILLTMIMIVRERKREIGVFKAIGFSNVRIMLQFMGEALTLTTLGAAIGLIIGVVGGNPVTKTLVNNSNKDAVPRHIIGLQGINLSDLTDVHTKTGYTLILYGLGAAVLIAVIGSALASFFISKVRPAEVLRSE